MLRIKSVLLVLALFLISAPHLAKADDYKPDDRVIFDLSAEDWVTTKTARLTVNVEAAVTSNTAGTARAAMTKALNDLIKTDWRLISFSRDQDSTGMEHWSAIYEARIPENQLTGIHEAAKKASKQGMQLTVSGIDFSPTLDEVQASLAALRTKIYKMANDQLAALNASLPGRNYRIALINFNPNMTGMMRADKEMAIAPMMHAMRAKAAMPGVSGVAESESTPPSVERSEKLTLSANIVFAVTPPAATK